MIIAGANIKNFGLFQSSVDSFIESSGGGRIVKNKSVPFWRLQAVAEGPFESGKGILLRLSVY